MVPKKEFVSFWILEKAKADLSFFSFKSSILLGPKVAIAISAADKNPDNRINRKTIIISVITDSILKFR